MRNDMIRTKKMSSERAFSASIADIPTSFPVHGRIARVLGVVPFVAGVSPVREGKIGGVGESCWKGSRKNAG